MDIKMFAVSLIGIAVLLTGFVGVPMKWTLGNRIGHDEFHQRFKAARKVGDPLAKRLFFVGWMILSLYIAGATILLIT